MDVKRIGYPIISKIHYDKSTKRKYVFLKKRYKPYFQEGCYVLVQKIQILKDITRAFPPDTEDLSKFPFWHGNIRYVEDKEQEEEEESEDEAEEE